jgi:hypothetical protein
MITKASLLEMELRAEQKQRELDLQFDRIFEGETWQKDYPQGLKTKQMPTAQPQLQPQTNLPIR